MKMKKKFSLVLLTIGLLTFSTGTTWAQDGKKSKTIGATVKEVFLKGSIDGKSLFMVYGFGDFLKDVKENADIMQNPIEIDDLKDLGAIVNAKDHDDDYVAAVKEGIEFTPEAYDFMKDGMQNAVKWPWKSIKKIPGSYKVSFDNARDAYHHSDSSISGVFKYAGHAIWANVKGVYYLVVEAPVAIAGGLGQMALGALGTTLALPGAIAIQTLRIGFKTLGITIKAGWTITKNAARVIVAFATGAYSLATSTIATSAALITAGVIGVYKGGRFLIVELPKSLVRPIKVKKLTEVGLDDQEEFSKKVLEALKDSNIGNRILNATNSVKEYSSKIIIDLKVGANKIKAIVLKLSIKNKLVLIKAEATRKYMNALKKLDENKDVKKSQIKAQIRTELQTLVNGLTLIQ
jgi:hypothetical protein